MPEKKGPRLGIEAQGQRVIKESDPKNPPKEGFIDEGFWDEEVPASPEADEFFRKADQPKED